MSSEPKITVDLSRRPGETTMQHLDRIGNLHRLPGRGGGAEIAPSQSAPSEEITEEQVAKMREEALNKLAPKQPPKKRKR